MDRQSTVFATSSLIEVDSWLVCYLTYAGAIGVHHVDVDVAILAAGEGDSPLHLLAASAEGE
jgi:hypothetical protein